MNVASALRRNGFVLLLLAAFVLSDLAISWWNPMVTSRRFYKNDFTKTLYHHNWADSGPVFFGNSAVTGAYIEEESKVPLVEMGLSYGKLTDLKEILDRQLYHVEGQLVVGIDVHTMIDSLQTDPTYQWFKPWYQPYVYAYRDYFRDTGTEFACALYQGLLGQDAAKFEACAKFPGTLKLSTANPFAYEPRWIDKELYFGQQPADKLKEKEAEYDSRFGWMSVQRDFKENLAALDWILNYAEQRHLPLRVVWMPWNRSYELPRYMPALKAEVDRRLQQHGVPTLDLLTAYDSKYFHDLVHLSRKEGAPVFTKEVDTWLQKLASSSK
ncbi:hypothetical protein [Paenibacillus hamazuiensis]|uniref:hypothetical protein n=1 Tax=Paenibacillus hamazuiensis TaxID=2936508 RepID=UPI00200FFF92|nr:hypothetical protein [Paenibacillus hamazuiensis]